MEQQTDFLFADGPEPELHPPHPLADFYHDVAALWELPIGERVHVALRSHQMADLHGRLELHRAPDLPLDRHAELVLRIGQVEFTSRQIIGWSLV